MAFPRARLKRFNEMTENTPGVGAYNLAGDGKQGSLKDLDRTRSLNRLEISSKQLKEKGLVAASRGELPKHVEDLHSKLRNAEEKIIDLEILKMGADKSRDIFATESETLKSQVQDLQISIRSLEQEREQLLVKLTGLEQDNFRLQNENNELSSEKCTLSSKLDSVVLSINTMKAEVTQMQEKIKPLEESKDKLEGEVSVIEQDKTLLIQEKDILATELAKTQTESEELNKIISESKEQILSLEKNTETLKEEHKKMASDISDLEENLSQRNSELSELEEKYKEVQKSKCALQEELVTYENDHQTLLNERNKLLKNVETLSSCVSNFESRVAELEQSKEELQKCRTEFEAQQKTFEEKLKVFEEEKSKLLIEHISALEAMELKLSCDSAKVEEKQRQIFDEKLKELEEKHQKLKLERDQEVEERIQGITREKEQYVVEQESKWQMHVQNLEEENRQLKEQLQQYSQTLNEQRSTSEEQQRMNTEKISMLETERNSLRKSLDELEDRYHQEIEEQDARYKEICGEKTNMERDFQDFKNQREFVGQKKELLERIDYLERQNAQYFEEYEEVLLKQEIRYNDLEEAADREKAGLKDMISEMEEQIQKMEERIEAMIDEQEKEQNWKAMYEELEKKMEPFKEILDNFELERKLLQDRDKYTSEQIEKLTKEAIKNMGHQNHKQKVKYVDNLKQENINLHKKFRETQQELYRQTAQVKKYKERLEKIEGTKFEDKKKTPAKPKVPLKEDVFLSLFFMFPKISMGLDKKNS